MYLRNSEVALLDRRSSLCKYCTPNTNVFKEHNNEAASALLSGSSYRLRVGSWNRGKPKPKNQPNSRVFCYALY